MRICTICSTRLRFGNTPTFSAGKLRDGGVICTNCFKKVNRANADVALRLKRYSSIDIKNLLAIHASNTITTVNKETNKFKGEMKNLHLQNNSNASSNEKTQPNTNSSHDLTIFPGTNNLNTDLLYISDMAPKDIPIIGNGVHIKITFENGVPKIKQDEKLDPSTIFRKLAISKPLSFDSVEKLSYWPSYSAMQPTQRFIYLSWLNNVTLPIDMGYVFVYYYGLERQLLFGNFEKAFNEIIKLRLYHKNKSFQRYSEDALIFSCFYNKRLDLLLNDYGEASLNRFSNIQLEFALKNKLNLSAQNIILVFKEMKLYKSLINGYEDLFEKCVLKTLKTEYNYDFFPLNRFDLTSIKDVSEQGFANYSFPNELRYPIVKDVLNSKDFKSEVTKVFSFSYDDLKKEKAILRKVKKDNLSEDQKEELKRKKEISRLKKLYDTNILKKDEYELLLSKLEDKKQ